MLVLITDGNDGKWSSDNRLLEVNRKNHKQNNFFISIFFSTFANEKQRTQTFKVTHIVRKRTHIYVGHNIFRHNIVQYDTHVTQQYIGKASAGLNIRTTYEQSLLTVLSFAG